MIYDADQSTFPPPAGVPIPPARRPSRTSSSRTTRRSASPTTDTQFSGRSDYQAFIVNNIPAGGLFTGAEVPKTAAQQAIWGGTTGAQFDPCYHAACDTLRATPTTPSTSTATRSRSPC